jgi:predicted small lipoprotein YifL
MTGQDLLAVAKLRVLLLIFAASLGGCGQRGPLVLPAPDAAPVVTEAGPSDDNGDGSEEEGETSHE